MVKDNELRTEYVKIYDKIHASDDLKNKVLKLKKKKRTPKPFIASAATVAAGIMIFAAVHNVQFDRNSKDDVISETVTTVEGTGDNANSVMPALRNGSAEQASEGDNELPETESKNAVETDKPKAASSSSHSSQANKTKEQLEKEAEQQAERTYEKARESAEKIGSSGNASSNSGTDEGTDNDIKDSVYNSTQSYSYIPHESTDYPKEKIITDESNTENDTMCSDEAESNCDSQKDNISASSFIKPRNRGITFSMNTSAALSLISQNEYDGTMHTQELPEEIAAVQEQWDNNRYFNYIGKNIISCIESTDGFVYIGDESAWFMIDEKGKPQNDSRIFSFSNGSDRVNIITSKDTTFIDAYMSEEKLLKSDIKGTPAIIFDLENEYKCYMKLNEVSYIIDIYTEKIAILENILMSL